ncbi:hypothetical protein [Lacrimispora aerotolerans]|uniref:hypothetical protein n=1 Tax=Lacrimispora aerotolerans TaxID=36832 RepID=UPI0004799FD8|nr:hypothetical protein [Lacrimispora aerotolerans]
MKQIDILKAKYIKQDKIMPFTCARCSEQKAAKKYAECIIDGVTLQICNGCYGYLKSVQRQTGNNNTDSEEMALCDFPSLVLTEGVKASKKEAVLFDLTDEEIVYVSRLVTPKEIRTYFQKHPKEFAKIRPGFRVNSLSDDDTITLVCKNSNSPFVASFLKKWIDKWLLQIQECRNDLDQKGASPQESLLLAISTSIFSDNIDLFFKISDEEYLVEYIALVKAALLLLKDKSVVKESDNGAAVALDQHDASELSAVKEKNAELLALIEQLRQKIEVEKVLYSRIQESLANAKVEKTTMQQDLDAEVAQNITLAEKVQVMQAELDHFYELTKYTDTEAEDAYNNEYEYASICEVFLDYYSGQMWLSRLADIKDGKITRFTKNEVAPHYFKNRDRLFWKNGPREEGFIGIWQWNAAPNKSDPSTDYVTTAYADNAKIIEVIELSECRRYEDIAQALKSNIFSPTQGRKCLFICRDNAGQIIGLLCNERDFDVNNGNAKLKSTVYTLPRFEITSTDILTVAGKKIYGFTSLGMSKGVFQIRNPMDVVKDVIILRATSAVLRQQGLSKKEAQHCQSFLKNLPLQTIFQEIADAYACTEAEAQEYVLTFIEQADSYLAENDLDIGTLAVALDHNKELVNKCKDLLTATWESENAERLYYAQQQLDEIESAVTARRMEVEALESSYSILQDKKAEVQVAIDEKIALVNDVERKIAERIATARKNASDFICEMAFSTPAFATEEYSMAVNSSLRMVLTTRRIDGIQGEEITDVETFVDELADNLSAVGYDDIIATYMAQMITFCIENRLPIVCGTNALKIADCVAAMFGNVGAYTTSQSISQPDCSGICAAIQNASVDKKCVVVVNGVFDGLSLNGFNEITLQSEIWRNNVVLIFPLNGVTVNMIPSYVWGQTMFIDGDTGLDYMGTENISIHTTIVEFGIRCTSEETTSKRKQLKNLSSIISNTAMLNYAKFMAETDSTLKDNTQILTQITLHALSTGKKELLLRELSSIGIDLEANKEISRYL